MLIRIRNIDSMFFVTPGYLERGVFLLECTSWYLATVPVLNFHCTQCSLWPLVSWRLRLRLSLRASWANSSPQHLRGCVVSQDGLCQVSTSYLLSRLADPDPSRSDLIRELEIWSGSDHCLLPTTNWLQADVKVLPLVREELFYLSSSNVSFSSSKGQIIRNSSPNFKESFKPSMWFHRK